MTGCRDTAATSQPASRTAAELTRTAQSGPVRATLRIDRDAVTIPETVALTLTLDAERGVEVTPPDLDKAIRAFGVVDVKQGPTTRPDAMTERLIWTCRLDPLAHGEAEVGPIEIAYVDARPRADGSDARIEDKVTLTAIPVQVSGEPADVKAAAVLPRVWPWTLLWWALGVLAVVLVIVWLARRKRRPAIAMARKIAPPIPAHEWARRELARLIGENLPEQGRTQEFYYRLNALVREYIERRFGLRAAEQTSEEFIAAVARSGQLVDAHKSQLQRFTAACDPVKYAKAEPNAAEIEWVLATAREFIEATAPTSESQATGVVISPPAPVTVEAGR